MMYLYKDEITRIKTCVLTKLEEERKAAICTKIKGFYTSSINVQSGCYGKPCNDVWADSSSQRARHKQRSRALRR